MTARRLRISRPMLDKYIRLYRLEGHFRTNKLVARAVPRAVEVS